MCMVAKHDRMIQNLCNSGYFILMVYLYFLSFRKEAKEQTHKQKKEKEDNLARQKKQQEILEKREKDAARAKAVEQWNAQKEEDQNKIVVPQHISPWKNGDGGKVVISRDEQMMANIKARKNKVKQRPQSGRKRFDSETEVEFVN